MSRGTDVDDDSNHARKFESTSSSPIPSRTTCAHPRVCVKYNNTYIYTDMGTLYGFNNNNNNFESPRVDEGDSVWRLPHTNACVYLYIYTSD